MKDTEKYQFEGIIELSLKFPTEESCRVHLEEMRWNGKPVCPHCENEKVYRFSDRKRFKCAKCRKQFTVTVGTIFEGSKLELRKWFFAIYLLSNHTKGISSIQLAKDLHITQKSAWHMAHRIRYAFGSKEYNEPLTGIVEADETFIGGKGKNKSKQDRIKLNKGTGYINKTPVFGMVERETGSARTMVISEAKGTVLKPILYKSLDPKATVVTDGFGGYHNLKKLFHHEIINHHMNEFGRGIYHTNTIEGFWSLLKRTILGTYHWTSNKHLQRYLDTISYRYNTRKLSGANRFNLMLSGMEGRLTYNQLTA